MSVALSDGRDVWAFRYASKEEPPSLYYSTKAETLRELYPDVAVFGSLDPESRLVVSEPLGSRAGAWNEVPSSYYGVIQEGQDQLLPFTPRQ
jgi:glutamine amidotransferase